MGWHTLRGGRHAAQGLRHVPTCMHTFAQGPARGAFSEWQLANPLTNHIAAHTHLVTLLEVGSEDVDGVAILVDNVSQAIDRRARKQLVAAPHAALLTSSIGSQGLQMQRGARTRGGVGFKCGLGSHGIKFVLKMWSALINRVTNSASSGA